MKQKFNILILALFFSNCSLVGNNSELQKKYDKNKSEIDNLSIQLDGSRKQILELKQELETFKNKVSYESFLNDSKSIAYLTPGASGYSIVQSDLGVLTVRVTNVKSYADGSKVTFLFGNLLNSKINGLTAILEWGSVGDDGLPLNEKAKTKEIKLDTPLKSGGWTYVPLVLEGVPPKEFGFVRLKNIGHTGIELMQ